MAAIEISALRKKIGHRIKVRRVELDLMQRELGERIGLPQSQISEWEIGRRAMRIEDAMRIAAALETTVGYLVGEVDRGPMPPLM
ncbi:MAG: helix-turn-helix transcriptional regulator [Thiohalocapsa sp.]